MGNSLAGRMLDIVGLLGIAPVVLELVDLDRHLANLDQVHGLPHLREAALAQQVHEQVARVQHRPLDKVRGCVPGPQAAV